MACGRAGRACSANSRRSICPGAPIPHIPPARDRTAKNMRRIDRANAGFSRKVSGIRDWANCMVGPGVVATARLIDCLQQGASEKGSLKRNGYFRSRPHRDRRGRT
jgi:hypothetical protein